MYHELIILPNILRNINTKLIPTCSASSGDSNTSSSSESDDHEEGEIEDSEKTKPQRKSRVDPKEIPEVSNKYLMRSAPSKVDPTKESDSDDKTAKHGKVDRNRKDSDSRGRNDAKGYVSCGQTSPPVED